MITKALLELRKVRRKETIRKAVNKSLNKKAEIHTTKRCVLCILYRTE